jgi:hypothetical protein
MHWMDGFDWVWMTLIGVFWIVFAGAVLYVAARVLQRPPRGN